jgi:hypothetical protein
MGNNFIETNQSLYNKQYIIPDFEIKNQIPNNKVPFKILKLFSFSPNNLKQFSLYSHQNSKILVNEAEFKIVIKLRKEKESESTFFIY